MNLSFQKNLFFEIGKEHSLSFILPQDDIFAGFIVDRSNTKRLYFKNSVLGINDAGSAAIARDKTLTNNFLNQNGFRVPAGSLYVFGNNINSSTVNFPCIIKPNSLSKGIGLSLVKTKESLDTAINNAFLCEKIIRIEEYIEGKHLCAIIYNSTVYALYEKKPFSNGEILFDYTDKLDINTSIFFARAMSIIGLVFGSIDFIYTGKIEESFNNNNIVILEINSGPSLKRYGSLSSETFTKMKNVYSDIISDYFK